MTRRRIFVSHSTKGPAALGLLDAVAAALRTEYEVLLDRHELVPGNDWYATVSAWLMECEGAVLLWNSDAGNSDYVRHEASVLSHRWRTERENFRLFIGIVDGSSRTRLFEGGLHASRISQAQIWPPRDTALPADPQAFAQMLAAEAKATLGPGKYELTRRNLVINAIERRLENVGPEALREAIARVGDDALDAAVRRLPARFLSKAVAGWMADEAACRPANVRKLVEAFNLDLVSGRAQLLQVLGFADANWLDRESCPIAAAVASEGGSAVVAVNGGYVAEYTLDRLALRGLWPGQKVNLVPCNDTALDKEEVAAEITAKAGGFTGELLKKKLRGQRTICLLPRGYPAGSADHGLIAELKADFPNVVFVTWPSVEPLSEDQVPYGDRVDPPIDPEAEEDRYVSWTDLVDILAER